MLIPSYPIIKVWHLSMFVPTEDTLNVLISFIILWDISITFIYSINLSSRWNHINSKKQMWIMVYYYVQINMLNRFNRDSCNFKLMYRIYYNNSLIAYNMIIKEHLLLMINCREIPFITQLYLNTLSHSRLANFSCFTLHILKVGNSF